MAANVAQRGSSRIKSYASAFSNILVANPCDARKNYKEWIMLTCALRALVNNLFLKEIYTTFMKNEKSCQNINCFFFFHKNFL